MSSQKGTDAPEGAKKPSGESSIVLTSATHFFVDRFDEVVTDEIEENETASPNSPAEVFDPNQPVPGVFIAPAPVESSQPAVSHTSYPTNPPRSVENPLNPSESLPAGCDGLFCVNPTCPCDLSRRGE